MFFPPSNKNQPFSNPGFAASRMILSWHLADTWTDMGIGANISFDIHTERFEDSGLTSELTCRLTVPSFEEYDHQPD